MTAFDVENLDLDNYAREVTIETDRFEKKAIKFWKDHAYASSIGISFDCMAKLYFGKRVDRHRAFDKFFSALNDVDASAGWTDLSLIAYPLSDHWRAVVSKNWGSRMKLDVGTLVASAWNAVPDSRGCEIIRRRLFRRGRAAADRPFEAGDAIEWIYSHIARLKDLDNVVYSQEFQRPLTPPNIKKGIDFLKAQGYGSDIGGTFKRAAPLRYARW